MFSLPADALHAILENCDNETMEQFGVFLTKGNEHAYALNVLAWIRKMLDKLTEFPAGSEDVLRSVRCLRIPVAGLLHY